MSQVIKATIATIAELAEIRHATTAWADTDFTSIIDEPLFCNFEISPNPATDIISFQIANCTTDNIQMRIFNVNGVEVYTHPSDAINGKQEINVDGWQRGTYLALIQQGNKSMTRKIILN